MECVCMYGTASSNQLEEFDCYLKTLRDDRTLPKFEIWTVLFMFKMFTTVLGSRVDFNIITGKLQIHRSQGRSQRVSARPHPL